MKAQLINIGILLLLATNLPAQENKNVDPAGAPRPSAVSAERTTPANSGSDIKYLGSRLPGLSPQVFAPSLIARYGAFNLSFSPDGKLIVFRGNRNNRQETRVTQFRDGRWTEPQVSPLFPEVPDFDSSGNAYLEVRGEVVVMEKTTNGWSTAKPLITLKKTGPRFSIADNGNIYVPIFAEGGLDIYVVKPKDGVYQSPEKLPDTVNSSKMEEHLFIAPDESYLLFDSDRAGGLGKTDVHISFHQPDGSWSQAKNLGAPINTPGYDYNVRVSPDGKYLFYVSGANDQLRWLDFQALVKKLKADL